MDRYKCGSWLILTINKNELASVGIHLTHHWQHPPYTDISISEDIVKEIEQLKDLTAAKIWTTLIKNFPQTNLMQKQVYTYWAQLHEGTWRLHNDQVQSALPVLQHMNNLDIEIILVPEEDGISSLAFNFKSILGDYGEEVIEIGMDSTYKKSLLYGVIGEANGQALPLAFAFTCSTDGTAAPSAKDRMLQKVLQRMDDYCPNIAAIHLDKDQTELSAFRTMFPHARGQLCYWHAIRYLEQQLAEDKPPAKYDPQIANKSFTFIDPTWAPSVMSGWLEDGVHNDDVECKRPDDEIVQPVTVCKSYILLPSLITHEPCPATINLLTASPCVDNCRGYTHSSLAGTSENKQG
ncbi:hypothetical protein L208DRAFT_1301598 [Tricholoma matsutake]|nr:hypothetical protein L208DRAFT_1301598 [Tricholoma matsutake 945]